MMCENRWNGFTLLELVLTIVIFALVGIMAVSFFNRGVTRSDIPISQLKADASLQLVLENMIQGANSYESNADMGGFNSSIKVDSSNMSNSYGDGNLYYVANKIFVCPDATNTFVASNKTQFLLVTIKPFASSGVSLSYIFGSTNNSVNSANYCGS